MRSTRNDGLLMVRFEPIGREITRDIIRRRGAVEKEKKRNANGSCYANQGARIR